MGRANENTPLGFEAEPGARRTMVAMCHERLARLVLAKRSMSTMNVPRFKRFGRVVTLFGLGRHPDAAGRQGFACVRDQLLLALLLFTQCLAAAPLTITTETLSNAVVGVAYSEPLTATGGTPPYTWAIQAGGLPSLLTLNPTNGQITGIPTASGSWVFSYTPLRYISSSPTQSLIPLPPASAWR